MTLVIGTICSDGMFFCADTEESTAGGFKRHVQKMYHEGTRDWAMVVATAGHGKLSEMAALQIIEVGFHNLTTFVADHRHLMEDVVIEIYKKYINPFPRDDERHRDRQFSLVIGVVDKIAKKPYLYHTEEEILGLVSHPFACAGVGDTVGNYYLDRLFRDDRPPAFTCTLPAIHEAEKLLQFVMKEAKSSVGYVGGMTATANLPFEGGYGTSTLGPGWEAATPSLSNVIDYFWLDDPEPKQFKQSILQMSKDPQ